MVHHPNDVNKSILPEDERKTFLTLLKAMPDLVWLKDPNGFYLFCNPKYERFLGVKESEILGKTDFDYFPKEQAEIFQLKDAKALEDNNTTTHTEWIKYADDGHMEFVETIKTPMYGSDGKVIGILSIARDITAHFQAENKLLRFKLGIENSSDAIFVTDVNGFIEFVNPAFEKIYGFSASETLGKTPRILKSGLIPPEAYKAFWETLLSGNPVKGELKNKTKDGLIIDVEASNNPIIDNNGNITGFLSINRDISDKKKVFADLILAKEKAEESDRLKTAFLNNISHEVRTPLNAITGFSALLSMPDNDSISQSMYVESILKGSDQLLSMFQDIIDMSYIEAKALDIKIIKFNLNSVIDKLYRQFQAAANYKSLTLFKKPSLHNEKAEILSDLSKLTRSLSNLIDNAIKFTTNGNISFGYEVKDSMCEFYVSDTGIGIPGDMHTMIFDKFFQVEKNLDRNFEGAGLGLSLTKAFIERLGGKIWLTSEPGIGSTFYFSLPFIQPTSPVESQIHNSEALAQSSPKRRIALVAEDNIVNFDLIKTYLETINFSALQAVDGKEAVELAKTNKNIDLVLMDIRMPVMNGCLATKQIREFLPKVLIIAQSAYFDNEEDAINCGCNDFIIKPFTREQFIAKIKEKFKDF